MLTPSQLGDARDAYASMVISGTSLSEAEAMEIATRFYSSGSRSASPHFRPWRA